MEDWDKTLRYAIDSLSVSCIIPPVPILLSIKAGVAPALAMRNAKFSGLRLLLLTITTSRRVREFHMLLC